MDGTDREIVALLRKDARRSFQDIGRHVHLSAPAVKRRVDRLLADGVLRGFTAVVDPGALGWTTEAYVEVYCTGNVAPTALRAALEKVPEVVGACTVSGAADALVHVLAEDVGGLERALERIRAERGVDHTETTIVLSRLIDRPRG